MYNRYLSSILIVLGIGSGLVGNYSNSTPNSSKLLPPDFAFGIWAVIYTTGIYVVYKLLKNQLEVDPVGIFLIALGYFLSGLWIRVDGHPLTVAILAICTLLANVSSIYVLKRSSIQRTVLNLLATFAGWITIATSLVLADALRISTSSDRKVAVYLAASLAVAFAIFLALNTVYGYIGTVAWATFSLLFSKSSLGAPGYIVNLVGFSLSLFLVFLLWRKWIPRQPLI
jgi:tryptophan-rich sensory protein